MKKFYVAVIICCLAASCASSPEKKAEKLVKEEILKTLYIPESYEAVNTRVDSAFSPYADPAILSALIECSDKLKELDLLEREMAMEKSSMSIWTNPYMSSYARNEYNEAKNNYEKTKLKYDRLKKQIDDFVNELKNRQKEEPSFIGYLVIHSFRASNNAGDKLLDAFYFIVDKDFSKVLYMWSADDQKKIDNADENLSYYIDDSDADSED